MDKINQSTDLAQKSVKKSKSKILAVIFIVITVAVIGTGVLLKLVSISSENSTNNNNQEQNEEDPEDEEGNEVEIDGNENNSFEYVSINRDDTVSYFKEDGSEVFISIDKKDWKDIKYSPSGEYISGLAKSDLGTYDIYLYNIEDRKLERTTNFNLEGVGVNSYFWNSDKKIYFHQGENVDSWLYSYDLDSKQLLKIERVLGNLHSLNSSRDLMIYKNNEEFGFYNLQGDELWSFTSLETQDEQIINKFNAVYFTASNDKLLAKTDKGKLYKFNFENDLAVEVTSELEFNIVCTPTEDLAIGYQYSTEFETLLFTSLNTKNNTENVIAQIKLDIDTIQKDSFVCEEPNSIYFRVTGERKISEESDLGLGVEIYNDWYVANEEGIQKIDVLKNSKFILKYFKNEQ